MGQVEILHLCYVIVETPILWILPGLFKYLKNAILEVSNIL